MSMSNLTAQQELQKQLSEAAGLMQEAGEVASVTSRATNPTDEDYLAVGEKWNAAFDAFKKVEALKPFLKVQ